jgi:hypothetical protein
MTNSTGSSVVFGIPLLGDEDTHRGISRGLRQRHPGLLGYLIQKTHSA